MPRVSIIILNWNGWEDTLECLESLYQLDYQNFRVIVVDNASNDDSINQIAKYCSGNIPIESRFFKYKSENKPINFHEFNTSDIKFIDPSEISVMRDSLENTLCLLKNGNNDGFAIGNNIGIDFALRYLDPDFLLLLNNDTVVETNFLRKLVEISYSDNNIGVTSPEIFEYYDPKKIQYSSDKFNFYLGTIIPSKKGPINGFMESDTVCGASMGIKREVIAKIGYLPTDYFMLWEDIDYSINVKRQGFLCGYAHGSKIWHKGSVSLGKIGNPDRIRLSIKNRILLWKKYATGSQMICFLLSLLIYHFPILFLVGLIKSKQKKQFCKNFFIGIYRGVLFSIIN